MDASMIRASRGGIRAAGSFPATRDYKSSVEFLHVFVGRFRRSRTQYRRLDLNQWPSPFQRDALPPELHRYQTEPTVGLEPTPFALRKRCSTELSFAGLHSPDRPLAYLVREILASIPG